MDTVVRNRRPQTNRPGVDSPSINGDRQKSEARLLFAPALWNDAPDFALPAVLCFPNRVNDQAQF